MSGVERAGTADIEPLARVLTRAFFEDPVAEFLMPDRARRPELLESFFRLQLRWNYLGRGEVLTSTDRAGAAMWLPPTPRAPRLTERLAHMWFMPSLGHRRTAAHRLTTALEERHPSAPHWYLGSIGTDPTRQRQGVGSTLIADVTRRCDEIGVGAYLECSRLSTTAFYARHGFSVQGVIGAPDTDEDGPRLYLMWRPAQSAQA